MRGITILADILQNFNCFPRDQSPQSFECKNISQEILLVKQYIVSLPFTNM